MNEYYSNGITLKKLKQNPAKMILKTTQSAVFQIFKKVIRHVNNHICFSVYMFHLSFSCADTIENFSICTKYIFGSYV